MENSHGRIYIGLDVSMKETAVSVRRGGKRVWRGRCASDPKIIAELVRKRAPAAKRVVFETGPLSVWFYHALRAEGLPAICIDARHAKAALDTAANKTDANDADGLAHLAEVGFFREVRVKAFDSMLTRTLVAARTRLVRITTELSNQIRGLMKTFGLLIPAGKGSTFERNVRRLLVDQEGLASIVLPMLEAWRSMRIRAAELGRQLVAGARQSQACRILMSIPGVGAITATSFVTAIEEPDNFKKSRSVGAWLGLTTRRYQSGETDYDGHISRRGDRHLRGLLYEAATVILTRSSADSGLRTWGLKLRERIGFKRAAVAVARKLAVTMPTIREYSSPDDTSIGPLERRRDTFADSVQYLSVPRRPCRDVGRAIPLDGVAPLTQLSASSTFEGSSREAPSCGD
jgi:transposase